MRNVRDVAGKTGRVIGVTETRVLVQLDEGGPALAIDGRNVRYTNGLDPNAPGRPVNSAGNCVGVGDFIRVTNDHGSTPGNVIEVTARA